MDIADLAQRHRELLEVAGVLGTVGVTAFGAGWALKSTLAGTALRDEKSRSDLANTRAQNAEIEFDKVKVNYERASNRIESLVTENAELAFRLKSIMIEGPGGQAQVSIISDLRAKLKEFDALKDALFGAEDELWNFKPPVAPERFEVRMRESRTRIVTVGNLKGGVGKTTLSANLAAHFALARGKRVLLIDFDYQGSLTRMMMLGAKLPLGSSILADALISGDVDGKWVTQASRELGPSLPGMRLVTCGPTFDAVEGRVLLRWLLGESKDDAKFRLAHLLLSQQVQDEFDLVIIDAPPRQSMGAVNALCASHAVLVPTIPDRLSVETVGRFLNRMNKIKELNSALLKVSVVPSLTENAALKPHEQDAMKLAEASLELWHGQGRIMTTNIRHFTSLGKAAGREIGYLADKPVRDAFDRLGEEVAQQWQV